MDSFDGNVFDHHNASNRGVNRLLVELIYFVGFARCLKNCYLDFAEFDFEAVG